MMRSTITSPLRNAMKNQAKQRRRIPLENKSKILRKFSKLHRSSSTNLPYIISKPIWEAIMRFTAHMIILVAGCLSFIAAGTVDYNDFSTGIGNWTQKNFGTNAGTVSFQNGWVRLSSGSGANVAMNDITPLALCLPMPTGDFTFETRFRQQTWGVNHGEGGEFHRKNCAIMVVDAIGAQPTSWIATVTAQNQAGPTDPGIALWHQTHSEGWPNEDDNLVFPASICNQYCNAGQPGLLIRITRVGSVIKFYGSADSVTWTQFGNAQTDNTIAYLCLIDTDAYSDCEGYTEFDFARLTQGTTGVVQRISAKTTGPKESFGLVHFGLSGSSYGAAQAFDLRGAFAGNANLSRKSAKETFILRLDKGR